MEAHFTESTANTLNPAAKHTSTGYSTVQSMIYARNSFERRTRELLNINKLK